MSRHLLVFMRLWHFGTEQLFMYSSDKIKPFECSRLAANASPCRLAKAMGQSVCMKSCSEHSCVLMSWSRGRPEKRILGCSLYFKNVVSSCWVLQSYQPQLWRKYRGFFLLFSGGLIEVLNQAWFLTFFSALVHTPGACSPAAFAWSTAQYWLL